MKYFVFAIDDGTIYDKKVIDIFNKYKIRATFNLNSGLQDFVWYKDNLPVRRLNLLENKNIYDNHEVASHSLTHPYLTMLSDSEVYYEVKTDIDNLEKIFNKKITSFSFPFDSYDNRTIEIIKSVGINHIIVPEIDISFSYPKDLSKIKVTSWNIIDALDKYKIFINDEKAEFFLYLSHSYDYEFDDNYDKLETLCELVSSNQDVKILLVKEI